MLYETINILIKVSTEFIPPIAVGYYVIRHLRQRKSVFLLIAIDNIEIWGVRERSLACMINRRTWFTLSVAIGSVKLVISNLLYANYIILIRRMLERGSEIIPSIANNICYMLVKHC